MSRVMKAMVLTGHGGLDKYAWREDWPMPAPGPMEALVRVGACGLNNTDVNTRTGWYSKTVTEATTGAAHAEVDGSDPTWGGRPIGFPRIQGADAVGEVVHGGRGRRPCADRQAGHGGRLAARLVRAREHGEGRLLRIGGRRRLRRIHRLRRAQHGGGRLRAHRCRACDLLLLLHHGRRHAEPGGRGRGRHGARARRLGRRGRRADPACQAARRAGDRDGRRSQARRRGEARPRPHPAARAGEPERDAGGRAGHGRRRRRGRTHIGPR